MSAVEVDRDRVAAAAAAAAAKREESYALKAIIGGFSCAAVAACLNPLDVTRIRLQLQANSSSVSSTSSAAAVPSALNPVTSTGPYKGMVQGA
jgi:hypothetical protein